MCSAQVSLEFAFFGMEQQGKTVLAVAARADEAIIVDMIIKAERYYAWRKVRHRN